MRNSSTCFGKLTILSGAILNPIALGPLGIKLGAKRLRLLRGNRFQNFFPNSQKN
jgi:hypothetical protein